MDKTVKYLFQIMCSVRRYLEGTYSCHNSIRTALYREFKDLRERP
jgi:hypothetical protein